MNFYFIAYIFLAIGVGLGVPFKLFQTGRMISAILFLILSIFIFIFFGVRWFSSGAVVGLYTGSWPPLINTCPDYLVYYKKGTVDTCIDLIGVNRSGGALAPWSQDDNPKNPPQAANKYFPFTYKAGMSNDQLQILCNSAQQLGLTWEGITNGESCVFAQSTQVLGPNTSKPVAASCPPAASGATVPTLESQWSALSSSKVKPLAPSTSS
jgi:hypothetical protein